MNNDIRNAPVISLELIAMYFEKVLARVNIFEQYFWSYKYHNLWKWIFNIFSKKTTYFQPKMMQCVLKIQSRESVFTKILKLISLKFSFWLKLSQMTNFELKNLRPSNFYFCGRNVPCHFNENFIKWFQS